MNLLLDARQRTAMRESASVQPAIARASDKPTPADQSAARAAGANIFASKHQPGKKSLHFGLLFLITGIFITGAASFYYSDISPMPVQKTIEKQAPIFPVQAAPQKQNNLPALPSAKTILKADAPEHKKIPPQEVHENKRTDTKSAQNETVDIRKGQETLSIDSVLASAYQAYQDEDYPAATLHYREALALEPRNRDALLGLGVISQRTGNNDMAVAYYRQVLLLDPRDPVAHAGLASFGNSGTASKEAHLKQLIAHQPDAAALHFALGNQYTEQLRWSDAQQSYFNALTMEPRNALFAFSLATSLDHLGLHKFAGRYYQQALDLSRSDESGFSRSQTLQRLHELSLSDK